MLLPSCRATPSRAHSLVLNFRLICSTVVHPSLYTHSVRVSAIMNRDPNISCLAESSVTERIVIILCVQMVGEVFSGRMKQLVLPTTRCRYSSARVVLIHPSSTPHDATALQFWGHTHHAKHKAVSCLLPQRSVNRSTNQ